jgi:hypothetical protein
MTAHPIDQLADTILRELTPRGLDMAKHYAWLAEHGQFRPDAGNFFNALATSPTYKELSWIMDEIELAQIEVVILKRLKS